MDEKNFTVAEIASIARCHPKTVRIWCYSGLLRASLVGGRILITEADFKSFIRQPGTLRKKMDRGDAE